MGKELTQDEFRQFMEDFEKGPHAVMSYVEGGELKFKLMPRNEVEFDVKDVDEPKKRIVGKRWEILKVNNGRLDSVPVWSWRYWAVLACYRLTAFLHRYMMVKKPEIK